jgi:hypothetical protein
MELVPPTRGGRGPHWVCPFFVRADRVKSKIFSGTRSRGIEVREKANLARLLAA